MLTFMAVPSKCSCVFEGGGRSDADMHSSVAVGSTAAEPGAVTVLDQGMLALCYWGGGGGGVLDVSALCPGHARYCRVVA